MSDKLLRKYYNAEMGCIIFELKGFPWLKLNLFGEDNSIGGRRESLTIVDRLAIHGAIQKVGDAAAGAGKTKTMQEAYDAMAEVIRLLEGHYWSKSEENEALGLKAAKGGISNKALENALHNVGLSAEMLAAIKAELAKQK